MFANVVTSRLKKTGEALTNTKLTNDTCLLFPPYE